MKKLKLVFILTMALGLVFTSCKKDDDAEPVDQSPNINFKGGANYISVDATVTVGENFTIGINASSNTDSGKDLVSVKYTVTSNNTVVLEFDSVFKENNYDVDYIFRMDTEGEAVIKFEVTDKVGEKASVSLKITAESGTTPIGSPEVLYWERVGGNAATGLAGFGLKWENNVKETHAVIEKDAATKLVQLSAADWTSIATHEDLVALVDAADDMADYRGISTTVGGTYDEVLATIYNGEYFDLVFIYLEVTKDNNGTTIKIQGESKK